mmetsp:Transcript_95044/g.307604  ORF Transcript_95044/g.307604 Transcript_95044/m.307604 type:complete len:513 (-) Transcript_95044:2489-4027(-)
MVGGANMWRRSGALAGRLRLCRRTRREHVGLRDLHRVGLAWRHQRPTLVVFCPGRRRRGLRAAQRSALQHQCFGHGHRRANLGGTVHLRGASDVARRLVVVAGAVELGDPADGTADDLRDAGHVFVRPRVVVGVALHRIQLHVVRFARHEQCGGSDGLFGGLPLRGDVANERICLLRPAHIPGRLRSDPIAAFRAREPVPNGHRQCNLQLGARIVALGGARPLPRRSLSALGLSKCRQELVLHLLVRLGGGGSTRQLPEHLLCDVVDRERLVHQQPELGQHHLRGPACAWHRALGGAPPPGLGARLLLLDRRRAAALPAGGLEGHHVGRGVDLPEHGNFGDGDGNQHVHSVLRGSALLRDLDCEDQDLELELAAALVRHGVADLHKLDDRRLAVGVRALGEVVAIDDLHDAEPEGVGRRNDGRLGANLPLARSPAAVRRLLHPPGHGPRAAGPGQWNGMQGLREDEGTDYLRGPRLHRAWCHRGHSRYGLDHDSAVLRGCVSLRIRHSRSQV